MNNNDEKMDKKRFYWFLFIIISIGILFSILSLNKDFTGEEMDFVRASFSVVKTGHPIYYQNEQFPIELALWHPPMYIYLLSLIQMFSSSEIAIRSLNVLAIILTSLLIYLFCKNLLTRNGKTIGLIASSLFLINYYVLSSSLLIDIDALSTLFVFSFIYFSLMSFKTKGKWFIFLSIISFIFALGNRYPIALAVFFSLLVYFYFNKKRRVDLKNYIIIGSASMIVFLMIWTFYSTLIEPGTFLYPIIHNAKFGSMQFTNFQTYFFSFLLNIAQIIRLFTIPALILFIYSIKSSIKKKDDISLILSIYTLVILILFIIVPRPAFGYPRYFLSLMPGFFILISIFVFNLLNNAKFERNEYFDVIFISIISLIILILFNPQLTLYRNDGLIKSTNLPDFIFNLLGLVPLFFVFLMKKEKRFKIFILSVICLLLVYSFYFDIKYVTNDSHIKDVGNYIKENTNSSDYIIAPKAVAYYADRKDFANDYYKPQVNQISASFLLTYFKNSLYYRNMDITFFWGSDIFAPVYYSGNYTYPNLNKSKYYVLNFVLENKKYEKKIGDYYIYKLN